MKTEQTVSVCFSSNDYSDSPSTLRISLTEQDINNINNAQKTLKENKEFSCIKINTDFELLTEDDEGNLVESDWRAGVTQFIVYDTAVYLYAQNKYDAGDQVEAELEFNND